MAQAPLGAVVDAVRAKRALIAGAVVLVTATCLVIPLAPHFWTVTMAGLVGALAGVTIGPALAVISLSVVGPDRSPDALVATRRRSISAMAPSAS